MSKVSTTAASSLAMTSLGVPLGAHKPCDAQRYVAWLAVMTGRPYRLLTEAECSVGSSALISTKFCDR